MTQREMKEPEKNLYKYMALVAIVMVGTIIILGTLKLLGIQ